MWVLMAPTPSSSSHAPEQEEEEPGAQDRDQVPILSAAPVTYHRPRREVLSTLIGNPSLKK